MATGVSVPSTSYLPLAVVQARFQAGLFAALCTHRPESFHSLINLREINLSDAFSLTLSLQGVLNPTPLTQKLPKGVLGKKLDASLKEAKDERPTPPVSVRSVKPRREWDEDSNGIHYFIRRDWQKKFPRFDGLGWPAAQAILFITILNQQDGHFESALSIFKTSCLNSAYGSLNSGGTRSYNEMAKKVRELELIVRPPEVDFLELLRTAVTKAERDAAVGAERKWTSQNKMLLPEPPGSEHPSWLWVISWIEGNVIRGAEADKVEKDEDVEGFGGTDTKQMRQKLWGRPGQFGGLPHYVGLRVNGHFPPNMTIFV